MGDVAQASLDPTFENVLYKVFGINAELIIDHAFIVIQSMTPKMESD